MLKKYVKNLLEPLPALLLKAEKSYDEKAIHKSRVTIKKLRALASFLKFSHPGLQIREDLREAKAFFRAAGELRDIQVQENLQNELGISQKKELKAFFHEQQKRKTEARKNLKKQLALFGEAEIHKLEKALKAHVSGFETNQLEELAKDYIHTLWHGIRGDMARPSGKIPFHDIRKKVKKIQYLLLLFADWSSDTELLDKEGMERLEKLQTALGDWHDREVLLQQLSGFGNLTSGDLVEELQRDIEKRKREILKMLKKDGKGG
jgi:CHAD domain-containing protein